MINMANREDNSVLKHPFSELAQEISQNFVGRIKPVSPLKIMKLIKGGSYVPQSNGYEICENLTANSDWEVCAGAY